MRVRVQSVSEGELGEFAVILGEVLPSLGGSVSVAYDALDLGLYESSRSLLVSRTHY